MSVPPGSAGGDVPRAGAVALAGPPVATSSRRCGCPGRSGRAPGRAAELLDLVPLGGQACSAPTAVRRYAPLVALAGRWPPPARPGGLLLMDEPFAALDAITGDFLQGELHRIWAATGTAVLFVTHDVREAVRLGQRVVLLSSRPGTVVRAWTWSGSATGSR